MSDEFTCQEMDGQFVVLRKAFCTIGKPGWAWVLDKVFASKFDAYDYIRSVK